MQPATTSTFAYHTLQVTSFSIRLINNNFTENEVVMQK